MEYEGVVYMPDYAEMYKTLFRAMTMAITILQEAQQVTEEMYISSDETVLHVLPQDDLSETE